MAEIVPAILEKEFPAVSAKIKLLDGEAVWMQLDVSDGLFAPNASWRRPGDLKALSRRSRLEVHLMVERPEKEIEDWLTAVDRVIVHYEATRALDSILSRLKAAGKESGVALLLETPLKVLERFLPKVKLVLLMGIAQIGLQGQVLDRSVIERIKTLRERYPLATIAVDGGVNLENAAELVAAGAGKLVAGSAIWRNESPLAAFRQLGKFAEHAFARRQDQISGGDGQQDSSVDY